VRLPSPVPRSYLKRNPALAPIHAAFESGDAAAMQMLVGQPCTVTICNDKDNRYGGKVTRVTAQRIFVEQIRFSLRLRPLRFQPVGHAWQHGRFGLWVGIAETMLEGYSIRGPTGTP
jgi:hypothetical protein